MLGTIGAPELILILVIALVIFGPRKLPEIGKSLGSAIREFRKATSDFQRTFDQEVEAEKQVALPSPPPRFPAAAHVVLPAATIPTQPPTPATDADRKKELLD